ncbi:MAG: hypothetical protein AAF236_16290, partial [Verrucomicrobiota bacterium]
MITSRASLWPAVGLAILFVSVIAPTSYSQQTAASGARPDPSLRVGLESIYNAWRQATLTANVAEWERWTAYSRQVETRNRIVSQRLPFPQAFFEDPIAPPPLGGLISLGVLTTGQTATSTYFGKANFGGAEDGFIPDNILVLHFLNEDGLWKFDTLRVVKLGNDADLLLQIQNADFSFLRGEEFQPAAKLPPVAQPVNPPEFLAEAWIDSTGYETAIKVNGHPTGTFSNIKTSELIIGGLRRGQNTIEITIKSIELAPQDSAARRFELAVYAAKDASSEANRVFHLPAGTTITPVMTHQFVV